MFVIDFSAIRDEHVLLNTFDHGYNQKYLAVVDYLIETGLDKVIEIVLKSGVYPGEDEAFWDFVENKNPIPLGLISHDGDSLELLAVAYEGITQQVDQIIERELAKAFPRDSFQTENFNFIAWVSPYAACLGYSSNPF